MRVDDAFIDKLVEHTLGIEAETDDDLLADVQRWLIDCKMLKRVMTTAPCELPTCLCHAQLAEDGLEFPASVTCYRRVDPPLTFEEFRKQQSVNEPKRLQGRIKFFNWRREYGFVVPEGGGRDVFLHKHSLGSMTPEQLIDGRW